MVRDGDDDDDDDYDNEDNDSVVEMMMTITGCKESHFYSLPFGQAEANIY